MTGLQKAIATMGGIGYIGKGSGTIAAIAYCIIWCLIPVGDMHYLWQVLIALITTLTGVWAANAAHHVWGEDSSKVVIDEGAGMMITLLCLPQKWVYAVIGLVLFRFFDIAKPLGIRKMEQIPRGWGVMADDVLAGVYSWIVLNAIALYI
ncbi:MAG: phosphatidylglycerophosphatase A [Chitinophagaceae bacterium]